MSDRYFNEFVSKIETTELKNSINNIKTAVEKIWTNDVRIIKDFTSHGPDHSERIFEKLYGCLWPENAIDNLNEEELYVLILGVILHDIGMQCDVKKNHEILNVAVNQYNASFQVDFSAGTASSYSKEEQNEIRKNHHLLTAAWLDYIFCDENHELPTIDIESVPDDLREVLIDVCRFHSKLNISDCPEKSDIGHFRTRFIAALLRLGDELDIDRYRVNSNTVELFGYDIENSLFWYIHGHTKVTIDNHLIKLQVILNKGDYELYRDFFEQQVIDVFQKKNRLLTEIIVSNNITIGISQESAVVLKRQSKSLPKEIREHIETITKKQNSKRTDAQRSEEKNDSARSCNEEAVRTTPFTKDTVRKHITQHFDECQKTFSKRGRSADTMISIKPRSVFERMDTIVEPATKDIFILGINLEGALNIRHKLLRKANEGISIKLLALDPFGSAIEQFNVNDVSIEVKRQKIINNLALLSPLTNHPLVEIRITDNIFSSGCTGVDISTAMGRIVSQQYLFRIPTSDAPIIDVYSDETPECFETYCHYLNNLWDSAKPYIIDKE